MTATQQKLLDAFRRLHMHSIDLERAEIEGERFPREIQQIASAMEIALIDIEVLAAQMVEEEQ